MHDKQSRLKYIVNYFSSYRVYKKWFSVAISTYVCCICDMWHTPPPPPFPKHYYYIIIKSKRFNHVKNKDDNRTRRACPSHHQCSPFCRCGRSRVSPDSLRFQPVPACSPCCSEIFAVSLTADQLLVARMAVSEIKCNKNLVQLQKRNKSSC